jgi:HK97 family phage portal protein
MIKEVLKAKVKAWLDLDKQRIQNDSPTEVAMDTVYNAISTLSRVLDIITNSVAEINYLEVEDAGRYNKIKDKPNRFFKLVDDLTYDQKREIVRDLIFKGNCLIYDTKLELQHIPSFRYDNGKYIINDTQSLAEEDCILISLLSSHNKIFSAPYISRVEKEMTLIQNMLAFQNNYFKAGGIPSIILKTERPMSTKLKEKYLEEWKNLLSLAQGRTGRPYILDSGMEVHELEKSFKELEFKESLENLATLITNNMGVPSVLIESAQSNNIDSNVKLFYHTTVALFVNSIAAGFTQHNRTAYKKKTKIIPDIEAAPLLRGEVKKTISSYQGLYVSGAITKNELRQMLFLPKVEGGDEFLTPVNVAGSNLDPTLGGRPSGEEE